MFKGGCTCTVYLGSVCWLISSNPKYHDTTAITIAVSSAVFIVTHLIIDLFSGCNNGGKQLFKKSNFSMINIEY